jgi:hypothetical protein
VRAYLDSTSELRSSSILRAKSIAFLHRMTTMPFVPKFDDKLFKAMRDTLLSIETRKFLRNQSTRRILILDGQPNTTSDGFS